MNASASASTACLSSLPAPCVSTPVGASQTRSVTAQSRTRDRFTSFVTSPLLEIRIDSVLKDLTLRQSCMCDCARSNQSTLRLRKIVGFVGAVQGAGGDLVQ